MALKGLVRDAILLIFQFFGNQLPQLTDLLSWVHNGTPTFHYDS